MNIRKIITLATAGAAAGSISLFGLTAAYAVNGMQPVTFRGGRRFADADAGGRICHRPCVRDRRALDSVG